VPGGLRALAVTVEEPKPGAFFWVLLEQGVEWAPLSRAARPSKGYAKAMANGLLALQGLIEDLEAGPREPERAPASAKKGTTFGFGFGVLK
jgi:hypothetical protein